MAAKGITEFYPGINIFFNQYSIPTTLTQRIIPNESLESAHGPWLIPQSLHLYPEQTVIEFNTSTPKEEEALFRIYSSNEWVGSLKTIIPDFPSKEAKASLILPEVPIYRLSCGQICERSPGRCRLCDRAVLTAELSYKEEEAD